MVMKMNSGRRGHIWILEDANGGGVSLLFISVPPLVKATLTEIITSPSFVKKLQILAISVAGIAPSTFADVISGDISEVVLLIYFIESVLFKCPFPGT
ncbi:hypothetical protein L1887_33930 [Cichorium endivia]|nr:hypothetical protein L1887_33930 [Cichorium endivia]